MTLGKELRLERIGKKGRFVIVPMDHGISSGPISGIINMKDTLYNVAEGGATSVVLHKGTAITSLPVISGRLGLILHLSASTVMGPDPNEKVIVATVEEALSLGADAVSVHVNVGAETESDMLADLGMVSEECNHWNIPLLAMMYPRGPDVKDSYDVEAVKHVARIGAELGADIIKTNYTGSPETFKEVIGGCPVPVVVAGGPKMESDLDVLRMVGDAIESGAAGISIGRNIFQHENVSAMTKALAQIVLEGKKVNEVKMVMSGE